MPASSSALPRPTTQATPSPASPSSAIGNNRPTSPAAAPPPHPADLSSCLPDYAIAAIREALPAFNRQIDGFAMADAVLTGVETRTSSPIRIGRDTTLQS